MKNCSAIICILIVAIAFTSCKNEPKEPERTSSEKIADDINKSIDDAFKDVEGGSDELKDALKGIVDAVEKNSKSDVKIVPFRELREMLPEKTAGLKKVDKGEGSTTKTFGINVSTYEAKYSDGKKKTIKIQLIDTGGLGKAIIGAVPWTTMEVDKETKDGYEMTTEYKGHKAFEKYDERRGSGSLATLLDERFVLNIEGDGVKMKDLKEAREDVKIKRLIKKGKE